ncbi:MAG: hypothetical protein AAGH90_05445 [Pseudomonadota bacterium]
MRAKTALISLTTLMLGLSQQAQAGGTLATNLPTAEVAVSLAENVCVTAYKTKQPVQSLLPESARPFTSNDLAGRLHTRPYNGQIWAIDTLEGPIVIGTVADTPGGCQILAVTPFMDAVTASFETNLQKGREGFKPDAVQGSGIDNNGVTWNRYKTEDGIFLDTLTYALKGSDKEGTLHVVLKP